MIEKTLRNRDVTKWTCLLATVLFGWLAFLFSAFLVFVGMSALFDALKIKITFGSGLFFAETIVTILLSITFCIYVSGIIYARFRRMKPAYVYVALAILLIITFISFPAPFMYTTEMSG
jgi:hypothetical protein